MILKQEACFNTISKCEDIKESLKELEIEKKGDSIEDYLKE